mgnify:CR=1 FL=1
MGQKQIEQYKQLVRHHLNARQFTHAKEILAEARNVLHKRDDFDQLFLTLISELDSQLVPVELLIESDGETWVSIPGKMAPEQFTQKAITIFPGKLQLFGWNKGYEHTSVSLAFTSSDIPESVSVVCQNEIEDLSYSGLAGHERVVAALKAHHINDLLSDVNSFSAWFRMNEKTDRFLSNQSQLKTWDRSMFSTVHSALSQQADQAFKLTHLDARGHFIKVPEILTRKETIELGQYLASLD